MKLSLLLVGLLAFSGLVFAEDVPIAAQASGGFYSIQLRGTSVDSGGENVAVTLYDNTDDTSAFASITITDTDTSTVAYANTFDNNCLCFGVNSLTDVATFELAPGDYSVTETAHEYSEASVFYGSTNEASAGWFYNVPDPTYTTDFTVTAATPEPASFALLGAGLTFLGFRARKLISRR